MFPRLTPDVSPADRLSHQARISASVNAMRILNTGTEVEAAVADALVQTHHRLWFGLSDFFQLS